MGLRDFLERLHDSGGWDSTGEFTVDPASAVAKLKKFSFPRQGQWALKLVQHAVSGGARELEIYDEGEGLGESIGLRFRYDSTEPKSEELESVLGIFLSRCPDRLTTNHLTYGLLGALKSSRLGPTTLRPIDVLFTANANGYLTKLDVLAGQLDRRESTEQKWTYSLSVNEDRPMFSYSYHGHSEIQEVRKACTYCPIRVSIDGRPLVQADDGFLHTPMLLHLESRHIVETLEEAGNPIWVPRAVQPVSSACQVAIPRSQTSPSGCVAGTCIAGEKGRLETHFFHPAQQTPGSSIIPVVDGVTMEPVEIDTRLRLSSAAKALRFTAIVACPHLHTDQSHGRVVQDQSWQAVVQSVTEQAVHFSRVLDEWVVERKG